MAITLGKGVSFTDTVDLTRVQGTLAHGHGGTGVCHFEPGQILIGTSSGCLSPTTISAGAGIDVESGCGRITISSPFGSAQKLLGRILAARMGTTDDQPVEMSPGTAKYIVRRIIATNASTSLEGKNVAGGIYTAQGRGGSAVVGASQGYGALTSPARFIELSLTGMTLTDVITAAPLYLALTSTSSVAATIDLYIFGDDLS